MPACSAAIPGTPTATTTLDGASSCTEVGAVMLAATGDLVVDGYKTLGTAYTAAGTGPYPHGIDFVLPYDPTQVKDSLQNQIVVLARRGTAAAHNALVTNVVPEPKLKRLHFHAPDTATFQVAIRSDSGRMVSRHFSYRAFAGPSMGGFGSSVNFWLRPERYDAIAVMGADPGPDLTYSLGMIHDYFVGGFCTAADGANKIGQLCPTTRKPLLDQMEVPTDFEHFPYQKGEGVGLTLRRSLFIRANRDLTRAMGNAAYYNPASPYLPPGVPDQYLQLPVAQQCSQPVVLKKFFDVRYNPTGSFDVITFCDGNDSDAVGLGNFDPAVPATNPVQIVLAVDVNGNGKRDSGEPVLVQSNEPFDDVGIDGVPDAQEPGYDPVTNPDPNGDDYHYLWNPTGTENNWRYDQGEPFQDVGIDGIPMANGGCPMGSGADCWDYGEGNGKFDYVPGQVNWRKHDPRQNLEAVAVEDFDRFDVYYDAGIRDFFNAQVSTNSLMGALSAKRQAIRAWDGFPALLGLAPSKESGFEIAKLDIPALGRHVFVRYGDPDTAQAVVESTGDGRHVGTALQAVHRAQMMLYWLGWRWPDGDRKIPMLTGGRTDNNVLVQSNGRMTPYVVVLPPGYDSPDEQTVAYPVVYLGHGLGMKPEDLAQVAVIAQNGMVDSHISEAKRMPKFIIVSLDGACRPDGGDVTTAPLPANGDLCEEGAFYTDHPEGQYQGESMVLKVQDEMAMKYRVRPEADVLVEE